MLEIEEKFKESGYKESLLESLYLESQKIKRKINSGLSPDDFERYSKYSTAIDSSVSVLKKHKSEL